MHPRTLVAASLPRLLPALLLLCGLLPCWLLPAAQAHAQPSAIATDAVWIEAELDDPSPYVQQAVGLRLRLHYSVQLVSGQLDQPAPVGIVLHRVGNDLQYTRDVRGRRVQVIERRYVLVPERSGRIDLPPATFRGRGVGGLLHDFFGRGQRSLAADGPALVVDARPVPDGAPRPWLPLHGLQSRWLEMPDSVRAGEAFSVAVELVADGATAAQLEPPVLEVDAGAEVFPDPVQYDETVQDGRPRVRMVRRFSVLPERGGSLRIEAQATGWWDVGADRAMAGRLAPIELEVAPAAAGIGPWPGQGTGDGPAVRVPGVQGEVGAWPLATVAFALLWLLTLGWALKWRERAAPGVVARDPGMRSAGTSSERRESKRALRHALDAGDLGEVEAALCGLASPPARDLDALASLLAPGPQRDAIRALQRTRWGGDAGGVVQTRARIREVFRPGPRWQDGAEPDEEPLPPLYPR